MRDPGGQLAERGHLLSLDQACLGFLQIVVGGLSGVSCRSDLRLALFALSDVAVDENEPAVWHGVAADLDHPPIRPCSLLSKFLIGVFETAADFRLGVFGSK